METGSWKWTCWGGAVKREIQIYKTSKKTGKSGAGEAPGDIVLDGIVIQPAGVIEKIVQWHNRGKKICWLIPKCGLLRPVRAVTQLNLSDQFILSTCPVMHADMIWVTVGRCSVEYRWEWHSPKSCKQYQMWLERNEQAGKLQIPSQP